MQTKCMLFLKEKYFIDILKDNFNWEILTAQ